MTQLPDGKMNIKNIPYQEKKQIYIILDREQKWKQLAEKMNFQDYFIDAELSSERLQGKSPSEKLFTHWTYHDHEVLELFAVFEKVGAYSCMEIIKKYIPQKYHKYIKQQNMAQGIQRLQIRNSKVNNENFVGNTSKEDNNKIVLIPSETRDNNITTYHSIHGIRNNINSFSSLSIPRELNDKDLPKFLEARVIENAGSTPQIPYLELQEATNNWTEFIGKGGFGNVYKGKWKNTEVAIKVLELKVRSANETNENIRQIIAELSCLNRYRHDNILPLYGYSVGGPNPCLVYQYMRNGSLDFRLRGSASKMPDKWLSWDSRLNIAIGVSRGLQYLHTVLTVDNKPLVHCDIKSANILLDSQDQPRIGDFGLAKKGPEISRENMAVHSIKGTPPYVPADYIKGKQFSVKVDVYSFGVVLFELATGLAPANTARPEPVHYLRNYVITYPGDILDLKDKRVPGLDLVYTKLIKVGKKCVASLASERPHMVQVLEELETLDEGE